MSFGFRVAFDARMGSHPGIGRYIRELSGPLHSRLQGKLTFLGGGRYFQSFPNRVLSSKIYGLREQWELAVEAAHFDALHVPHFNIPVFYSKKLIVTIHDLTYVHDPKASRSPFGRAYAKFLFDIISRRADAVITVSQYTKNDLLNTFPKLKPEKVTVTHEAASASFRVIDDQSQLAKIRTKFSLEAPFVLFVGSLKQHKNLPVLIEAVKRLLEAKKIPHRLVVVGKTDPKEPNLAAQVKQSSFVQYLGEVGDEDLAALYNLADAFVLPSLREGFGLPVIEAMACGTPVICSNRSSLPEIAGDAALTFDPCQIDALEALLYNVLTDSSQRQQMASKGLERAKQFSWERTAELTLDVYQRVLS